MVDIKYLVRQADDLHRRAEAEADPEIRDRLNRMAEAYVHIAEIEAGARPASLHGAIEALTRRDAPRRADDHEGHPPPRASRRGAPKHSSFARRIGRIFCLIISRAQK